MIILQHRQRENNSRTIRFRFTDSILMFICDAIYKEMAEKCAVN